jgi:hypothetical protein
VEIAEPTQLSPSNEQSIITIELADICANSIVINCDASFRDNTSTKNAPQEIPSSSSISSEKSITVSQKVSSNPNNPPFSCEICGQVIIELCLHRLFCIQFFA